MQKWVVICWALLALVGADECPDGGRCEKGVTCCKHPANGYECCPFDQAECCEDHIHCCPASTVCDTSASRCVNATVSIPWAERASADQPTLSKSFRMIKTYMGEEDDNICPDLSRCPPEFSCLRALTRFGCCPLVQGIPCADGKHCCPKGLQCSADSRSCIKKELAVLCSDGVSECPDGTTCCENPDGQWGCCPLPKAVCCDDKKHCCPEGSTCDVEQSKCISSSTERETPMWAKLPARRRAEWENEKESEQTVAEPVHKGSSEKNPEVTTANTVPPSEREVPVSAVTEAAAGNNVPCDDQTACEDGTTCCKTKEGGWACCPLPEAVCCEDFIHCCPKDTTCNLAAGSCDGDSSSVPLVKKMPTVMQKGNVTCEPTYSPEQEEPESTETAGNNVPCDDQTACEDGTTCCKTKEGVWACCPLPEAVCCEDFIHCCPKDTTCNLAAGSCDGDSISMPLVKKMPTIGQVGHVTCDPSHSPEQEDSVSSITAGNNVPCDDQSACEDGTTCCKTKEGGWACCPLPEAVCCEDFIHCCPKDTTCNLAAGSCDGDSTSMPLVKKIPTVMQKGNVTCDPTHSPKQEESESTDTAAGNNVPCDDQTACEDGTTCCKTKEGGWACCPLPEAVCCEDFIHCCPKDTTCNLAAGSCDGDSSSVPIVKKMPTRSPEQEDSVSTVPAANNVPCDDQTACEDGTTCCKTKEGGWACCPLPEAVCCEDFIHCCPKDTTCNLAAGSCDGDSTSMPLVKKMPTIRQVGNVTCDPSHSPELKDSVSSITAGNNVPCDDQTACEDGTTCCKTKEGGWACCPLPEAVCCEDFIHCCPKDTTCNLAAGSCDGGSTSMPLVKKMPTIGQKENVTCVPNHSPEQEDSVSAVTKAAAGNDVPCDDQTACEDGTTCCKTKEGGWACCPLPEAVCCEDLTHCCPNGKKCNLAAGTCDDGAFSAPWFEKIPTIFRQAATTQSQVAGTTQTAEEHEEGEAMEVKETDQKEVDEEEEEEEEEIQEKVDCDSQHSCPSGTTCCYMKSSKKWGCCPLPNAVCCSDGSHCCPEDYKCDEQGSSCIKEEVVIPWYPKLPASPSPGVQAESGAVQCDAQSQCPEGTSCCQLYTGGWGCCPMEKAVCCPDMEHCCPHGYICNIASQACEKLIMLQLETVPLTPVFLSSNPHVTSIKHRDVKCDDQTSCHDGETCCRTSATTWGCCPYPNGVCCDDLQHCCPTGYACTDTSCTGWSNWDMFISNKKRALRL